MVELVQNDFTYLVICLVKETIPTAPKRGGNSKSTVND